MTHTPGPWRVHSEHADRIIVNGCCVYQVRDMTTEDGYAGNGYGQPSPADVRLMAAAPELLARLHAMVSGMECECDKADPEHPLCDVCWSRLVIAKAEGRTDDQ